MSGVSVCFSYVLYQNSEEKVWTSRRWHSSSFHTFCYLNNVSIIAFSQMVHNF